MFVASAENEYKVKKGNVIAWLEFVLHWSKEPTLHR